MHTAHSRYGEGLNVGAGAVEPPHPTPGGPGPIKYS